MPIGRSRQYTSPMVIQGPVDTGLVVRPDRVEFDRQTDTSEGYDERWLQVLIQRHPELLPVGEIEPAYRPLIPVCMELPTPRGFLDNFFITPNGNLVFAECKLWRNPEARRQVITQVMDYVESLTGWSYPDLESAVSRAESLEDDDVTTLYGLVADQSELEEAEFVDAVSRNLRLGRGLFFVVGDGIREEAETLAEHLQAHAGIHCVLAMTELALYRLPDAKSFFVQPRVLARTVNVERGIVRVDDGRVTISPPAKNSERSSGGQRARSLSADEFYEQLAEVEADLPTRLERFLDRLEPLGVRPEVKRTLILRWQAVDGTKFNLGYINTNGQVLTDAVNWNARDLGILDLTHGYIEEVASAIGGKVHQTESNPDNWYAGYDDRVATISDLLSHEDGWVHAIERFVDAVNKQLETDG